MEFVRRPITEKGRTIAISMGHTEYLGQKRGESGREWGANDRTRPRTLSHLVISIHLAIFKIRSLAGASSPHVQTTRMHRRAHSVALCQFFKDILCFGVKKTHKDLSWGEKVFS